MKVNNKLWYAIQYVNISSVFLVVSIPTVYHRWMERGSCPPLSGAVHSSTIFLDSLIPVREGSMTHVPVSTPSKRSRFAKMNASILDYISSISP